MADTSDYDVAIVGAGAAGLGAAKALATKGKRFVVLEASHRIGGRAYTEEILPGVPFDLGCHWLHSASINPFTATADELGFEYAPNWRFERDAFIDGRWQGAEGIAAWDAFWTAQEEAIARAAGGDADTSVYEATDREHRFTPDYDYVMTLVTSMDVDRVSVKDMAAYRDTGENWPVKQGFGALVSRWGGDVPVSLNTAVSQIDWSGRSIRLATPEGTVSAAKVIVTVSNGVLAARDIRFTPELPDWKHGAVEALPLGNHNRIALAYDRDVFGADAPSGLVHIGDEEPMSIRIHPFGHLYVVGVTGGRFADWLEKAGEAASADYLGERLKAAFGNGILKHVVARKVTAWRGDPWVKGAYSSALPGQAHQRARLMAPLDGKLYFAGEATSPDFYSTAHGARISGETAAAAL